MHMHDVRKQLTWYKCVRYITKTGTTKYHWRIQFHKTLKYTSTFITEYVYFASSRQHLLSVIQAGTRHNKPSHGWRHLYTVDGRFSDSMCAGDFLLRLVYLASSCIYKVYTGDSFRGGPSCCRCQRKHVEPTLFFTVKLTRLGWMSTPAGALMNWYSRIPLTQMTRNWLSYILVQSIYVGLFCEESVFNEVGDVIIPNASMHCLALVWHDAHQDTADISLALNDLCMEYGLGEVTTLWHQGTFYTLSY